MAGRIRSIKPEILSDERTAGLSDPAWRLFVSMIVLADDYGNLRAQDRLVASEIWWARGHRAVDLRSLFGELETAGLIAFYRVRDQSYAHLNGWKKHQRVDHPGRPMVPGPTEADDGTPGPVDEWQPLQDYTYIARGDDGLLKIGRSTDVPRRMIDLTRERGVQVTLVLTLKGGHHERALHRQFARLRREGEWFEFSQEIIDACTELATTTAGAPDADMPARRATDRRPVPEGLVPDLDQDLRSGSGPGPGPSISAAPEGRATPAAGPEALLTFPTIRGKRSGDTAWRFTETEASVLREGYPDLDVLAEARKAWVWIQARADRRKTAGGMMPFLVGWLGRTQNRGGARTGTVPAAPPSAPRALKAPPPDLCSFHREVTDAASSDPYGWCALCRKFGARPRRSGTSEPEPIGVGTVPGGGR